MGTKQMKIGELARATGTKVVTVRYYEKIGLLPEPGRSDGNYRDYGTTSLERLRFVRQCRELGFSLDQVRDLLALASDAARPCAEVDEITAVHLAEVERKIADLQALARQLRSISSSCSGGGTISNCRILDAISPD